MYTQNDFKHRIGKWMEFRTPWGSHYGKIVDVKHDSVLVKMRSDSSNHKTNHKTVSHFGDSHEDICLTGFGGGCFPCWGRGSWFWCWIPLIVIIFIFPCFCW